MNGQNEHLLNWLTPINQKEEKKPTVQPVPQGTSPHLEQWLTPIGGIDDELRAEKPDIKTRLRIASMEARTSPFMKVPFEIKKRTGVGRLAEGDFWKNTLQNLGVQSREFITGIPQLAESLQGLTPQGLVKSLVPPPRYKSVIEPKGYKPTKEKIKLGELPMLESLKTVGELIMFLPRAGGQLIKDPIKFIEERPLDTLFLIEAVGVRPAMRMRQRVKAGKPIHGRDIKHVIDKVPDDIIPKEVKETIRQKLPPDKEIPGARAMQIQKELGKKKPPVDESIKEFHSGYPLRDEIKRSFEFLRTGRPGGVLVDKATGAIGTSAKTGEVIKPPVPEKPPKIIKGGETEIMLEPYTIPTKEPLVIVKQKNKGTMPVFHHEIAPFQQKPVKDIPFGAIKQDFTTSQRIFDRYPPLKKTLYEPWRVADRKIFDANVNIKNTVIPGWKKIIHNEGIINPKKSSERIANYLTTQAENGHELLRADGKVPITRGELTAAELNILDVSRKRFDVDFVEINKARRLAGEKPLTYESNYYPFMRNLDYLKKEGLNIIMDDARTVEKHLSGKSFKYAIKRKMKDGVEYSVPIDLDFFKVAEDYFTSANEVKHITPIVAKARALTEDFKIHTGEYTKGGKPKNPIVWNLAQSTPKLRQFITRWADSLVQRTYIPRPLSGL